MEPPLHQWSVEHLRSLAWFNSKTSPFWSWFKAQTARPQSLPNNDSHTPGGKLPPSTIFFPPSATVVKAPKLTSWVTIKSQISDGIRKWVTFMESTSETPSAPDSVSSSNPLKPTEICTFSAFSPLFKKPESTKSHNTCTLEDPGVTSILGKPPSTIKKNSSSLFYPLLTKLLKADLLKVKTW